jgi:hypothetical protein
LIEGRSLPQRHRRSARPMSQLGQSRRFCDVSFSVRYPQYRTLSRPMGTGLPGSFQRPNCLRPAQPWQLRRSVLDRLRDMSSICGLQRPGVSTAPNPRGTCSRSACTGFLSDGGLAKDSAGHRRGADHRPLDSRIKGARCAAVGRVTVQRLSAIFLASANIARIRVLLCTQQVSAMCLALPRHQHIEAMPDQPTPVKARASRARLRRLAALTGVACPGV